MSQNEFLWVCFVWASCQIWELSSYYLFEFFSFFILSLIDFVRYNLHLIKCTHFKGTVWWVWTNVYTHITNTTIKTTALLSSPKVPLPHIICPCFKKYLSIFFKLFHVSPFFWNSNDRKARSFSILIVLWFLRLYFLFVCFLFLSVVRIEFPSLFLSSLILFSVFSIPLLILSNELLNLSYYIFHF